MSASALPVPRFRLPRFRLPRPLAMIGKRGGFIHSPLIASPFVNRNRIAKADSVTPFTTDWKSAGAGASDGSSGSVSWSSPGNITASDDSRTFAGSVGSYITEILRATNFGFTTSDIPDGATILGIEVGIERNGQDTTTTDEVVRLRTSSGQTGDNKADTGTNWPSSDTEATYGGASDNWNAGLSDSDIRGSDFGVDLQADASVPFPGPAPAVDHIRVRVHGEA